MNWKIKLVLLFGKLRKPVEITPDMDIKSFRRKSNRASFYGTLFFDKKTPVAKITNTTAEGIPVRVYSNSNAKNKRVIIFYHGGGFVLYGIYSHDYACRRLCAMNDCVVVAVDYRLAPEHTFPAAHNDAFTAIKWVRKNIEQFAGNPNDLVVCGDSAGGNLAACMAHRCKKENIPLKAQVLVYPFIDGKLDNPSIHKNGSGYMLEKPTMYFFQQMYTPKKEDRCTPAMSPCYEKDFSNLAPAFILTAEFDPLLDDGFNYAQQLKNAGAKVLYKEYKHLFHVFFNLPGMHPNAIQSYYDIKEFLAGIA